MATHTRREQSRAVGLLRRVAIALALTVGVVAGTAATTAMDSHPADAQPSAFDAQGADRAALTALAAMQDPATGLWPVVGTSAWWSSANDLTALIDASRAQGTHQYDGEIATTYRLDRDYAGPQWRNNGPDFKNHYMDDTAWWGLAWLDAYRWTGDRAYLLTAMDDDAYVHAARTSACSGGIPWAVSLIKHGDQLNAITNSLAMELSAQLATVTGRIAYRDEALMDWRWIQQSGLIGADGLVRDHLDVHCHPTGPAWSYTQGTISAALVSLSVSTGESSYLTTARHLADAATTSARLNPGGELADPCEAAGLCGLDGSVFKGAAMRGLGQLNAALPDHPYTAYLARQATTMFERDRLAGDLYGPHWAGPAPWSNPASQGSALDLLTATMGGA